MPPSRRRERRTIVPGMHTVDITSGQDQYLGVPRGYRAPKPGSLPVPNPAAAVTRQDVGPMTGGLAPKPSRPTTPEETKRGPIDKIAQSRLWKMFFGPDGQGGGGGGGPQQFPIAPGPGGTVPDMSVSPRGSLQYTDTLSGRTVIIGPRATEAEISRGGTPTPGSQFGESAVTMKDGRMVLTGPERPEAAAGGGAAAPAAVRTKPLSERELREIKAEQAAAGTLEAKVLLHEHFIETLGDVYLQSSAGKGQDEAMAINREIIDRDRAKEAVKQAARAKEQLEARQRQDNRSIRSVVTAYRPRTAKIANPEQLAKLYSDMKEAMAAHYGMIVTDEQLRQGGFVPPDEKQMATATWEPKVKSLNKQLAGLRTQKGATPETLQKVFVSGTEGMPVEFRNKVRIPRFGKKKAGVETVSIDQALSMASKFVGGSGKFNSAAGGDLRDRRAVEYISLDQYKSQAKIEPLEARALIMRGATADHKVPGRGDTADYPGLLKRYKAFERWATGWSPVETKKAWLRTLHEAGRGELGRVWMQWHHKDADKWQEAAKAYTAEATMERRGASDAGAQAAGKAAAAEGRAAGKPQPTPEQMRQAFEATKSKEEARELLRKLGFDI